jgi:hypothetical protein
MPVLLVVVFYIWSQGIKAGEELGFEEVNRPEMFADNPPGNKARQKAGQIMTFTAANSVGDFRRVLENLGKRNFGGALSAAWESFDPTSESWRKNVKEPQPGQKRDESNG